MATEGTRIMEDINNGSIAINKSSYIRDFRVTISPIFEEILEVGARIRPLKASNSVIGWVRGPNMYERRLINSWYEDSISRIVAIMKIATSLDNTTIENLDIFEFKSLTRLISELIRADLTLYPYVSAYTTTSSSESLWAILKKRDIVDKKTIDMLDGKKIDIISTSEHTRLWYNLCSIRDRSKIRLDESYNAAMIASSMIGRKGASTLMSGLNKISKSLVPNIDEPWKEIVRVEIDKNFDDGWGHAHEDDSDEGLLREGQGMLDFDIHEQFMDKFYKQQMEEEQKRNEEIEDKVRSIEINSIEDSVSIMTEAELNRLQDINAQRRRDLAKRAVDSVVENIEKLENREQRIILGD